MPLGEGDGSAPLKALELAVRLAPGELVGRRKITPAHIQTALQRRAILYDRAGDQHYDTISAFIKSVRGSDPNAALHYLARMLEAGEDPNFSSLLVQLITFLRNLGGSTVATKLSCRC